MKDRNWYDTAQICVNGHVSNKMSVSEPHHNKKFCDVCGERTIMACPSCNAPIRGHYHVLELYTPVVRSGHWPPGFCHNCGKPYPWTENRLKAAAELADEQDKLTEGEKDALKKSLDDIVRDTPRTTFAATKFKQLLAKAGAETAGAFKEILVDIVSETVKKMIWPSGST